MTTWIMQVPVIRSAHLSMRTTKALVEGLYDAALIAPYPQGMFIWLGFADPITGLPRDLKLLIKWARQHKIKWVRLDADAEISIDLPTYPWS